MKLLKFYIWPFRESDPHFYFIFFLSERNEYDCLREVGKCLPT